ncbi:MAG TPA: metal ABC transporter permease [Deinococcales bacterium]|nr:metal ABC transporter permease [Deinococcales bacterium]
MDFLLEPLAYPFFARAIAAVALVSALCAVVGVFVVLRGLSYISDALAHAVLPGIVGAFLLKVNLLAGALLAAILTALGISFVTNRTKLRQDSAIGIVFVGMFALGIALMSQTRSYARDLTSFLVGNALGVSSSDLLAALLVGLIAALVLTAVHKELLLASFDRVEARVVGLPVAALDLLLLVIISLVVVLAIQLVGTTLVVSLLVTSSASARLLTSRVRAMTAASALIGVVAGITGLYASYYLSLAPGATIVIANTLFFAAALAWRTLSDKAARRRVTSGSLAQS